MSLLLRYLPHLLALGLAFAAGAWFGYAPGSAKAAKVERAMAMMQRDAAQQVALAEQMARQTEQRHAADMARIGQEHQEALNHAKAASDRLVADLRAGTVRLQERWRGCAANVPGATGAASEPDAAASDREQGAADLVSAARACDVQVIGLQDVIRSGREK